ncbi:MAG: hypothetical protein NTV98_03105 [Candidatus Roizmanbacteria bacterium]|nr:hypothetical protein [Candidatus Roizmanbacteria bacterium]
MTELENNEAYKKKVELVEALAQLDAKEKLMKSSKGYGKAYFWSVLLPPLGIYYFVRYLFFDGGDEEHVRAGVISLVLTLVSLLVSILLLGGMFSQASSLLPSQGGNAIQEMITPGNQQKILDLYR